MFAEVPLFPERASTMAGQVDALFFFLLAVTGFVALLVTVLVIYFAVKYRHRAGAERTARILGSLKLETFWTVVPLAIFLGMFTWGASVYFGLSRPPDDAMQVYVVGKQWMWKIQHPGGQREINELHVPVDRPVKLTLTSEDVIHDFFVPAFRTKIDVLPGRYVQTWFHPTKAGRYHLFCSQYCGTNHAGMVGWVVVMERAAYDAWLNSHAEGSLALEGRKLFLKLQCVTCHSADENARAPVLEELYGKVVNYRLPGETSRTQNWRTVIADENYIRESIFYPGAKIVAGYDDIMPNYRGQVSEEEMVQLIAFLKSLGRGQTPKRAEEFPPPVAGAATTPRAAASPLPVPAAPEKGGQKP